MGAAATGLPLFPPAMVAGTITIAGGNISTPVQLLGLIQSQLDANCPGSARAVRIQAGTVTLFVGRFSPTGGALSATNFGYQLTAGLSAIYGSSYPGSNAPLGDLQVFMAAGTFSVEVLL